MNQNLLLKYISGKASQREKEEVAAWIDADAANLKEFMSLRKSYDALVWQDADELKTGRDKLLSLRTFTMKAMRIAAIFVLAFGLSYILIQTLQKENVEMQTVYVPVSYTHLDQNFHLYTNPHRKLTAVSLTTVSLRENQ